MKIQWIILLLYSYIVSVQSANNNIKELEKQRKMFLIKIENTNKFLNENQKSIGNAQNKLDLIVQQVNTRERLVKNLENEIGVFNKQIQDKGIRIAQMEKDLHLEKKHYAIAIQKMYQEKNNQSQLFFILSANNIAQSFHRMLYMKEYGKWRRTRGEEIITQQNALIIEKQVLKRDIQTRTNLANIKKDEEKKLQLQEKTKKTEIESLKKNAKRLQAEVDKKKKQAEALEKAIAKIIKEEIAASKKADRDKTKRKTEESVNSYAMTKEEQALSSDFAKNKGRLPFPLKGNYRIVVRFGQQKYNNMENIYYYSNGIDIKTTQENNARAVFDGKVSRVLIAPGYKRSVLIRHGNYLTIYSNLEQIFVKQDDKIKTGQSIGKIHTDKENEDLTILHFELWKEGVKLDPMPWLYQ